MRNKTAPMGEAEGSGIKNTLGRLRRDNQGPDTSEKQLEEWKKTTMEGTPPTNRRINTDAEKGAHNQSDEESIRSREQINRRNQPHHQKENETETTRERKEKESHRKDQHPRIKGKEQKDSQKEQQRQPGNQEQLREQKTDETVDKTEKKTKTKGTKQLLDDREQTTEPTSKKIKTKQEKQQAAERNKRKQQTKKQKHRQRRWIRRKPREAATSEKDERAKKSQREREAEEQEKCQPWPFTQGTEIDDEDADQNVTERKIPRGEI